MWSQAVPRLVVHSPSRSRGIAVPDVVHASQSSGAARRGRNRKPATVTIGPRTFVGPPFEPCPACGAHTGLGLLTVRRRGYIKRCIDCLAEQRYELPRPPPPSVLYLDQFAISNLAKALHPEHRHRFHSDEPATQRGFWPRFFARLERLMKLGLLVCPPSSVHRAESLLDDRLAPSLHRLHLHLSGGAELNDHAQVKRDQLYLAFCGWLDGVVPEELTREDVVRGGGEWRDRLQVTTALTIDPREVEAVRAARAAAVPHLEAVVREWSKQHGRSFAERWEEQLRNFGPGLLPVLPLGDTWILLRRALTDRDVAAEHWQSKTEEFLHSEAVKAVPFARLGCGLFAALGWLAEREQAGKVDRGLRDDFQAIATYAPYCDALLVDRRCRQLLLETPLGDAQPEGLRVFDARALDELEAWLDEIEADAPAEHVSLVTRIYGEAWLEPYASILDEQ